MNAEEFTRRTVFLATVDAQTQEIGGWEVVVETYRLGDTYFTTISSAEAGARFARGQGASSDEAEHVAMEKARRWLMQTRRFPTRH